MFFPYGTMNHWTHVKDPVAQYSAESDYNPERTVGTDLAHFRIIKNELMNKYTYVVQ